jgi:hypothetical protein
MIALYILTYLATGFIIGVIFHKTMDYSRFDIGLIVIIWPIMAVAIVILILYSFVPTKIGEFIKKL